MGLRGLQTFSLTGLVRTAKMYSRALERRGPLAQLVEQGTFNPKVAGSTPSRPTIFFSFQSRWQGLRLLHAVLNWAIVQRQDSGFWYQLSRFESWWPSHFTPLMSFASVHRAPHFASPLRVGGVFIPAVRRGCRFLSRMLPAHRPRSLLARLPTTDGSPQTQARDRRP